MFSTDARVVYSTDNAIIGELSPQNKRLLRALDGASDSHIEVTKFRKEIRNGTIQSLLLLSSILLLVYIIALNVARSGSCDGGLAGNSLKPVLESRSDNN